MKSRAAFRKSLAAAVLLGALPGLTHGAMGHTSINVGLFPSDVGSAQAFSAFGDQASAVLYNPASLTRGAEGELSAGLFYVEPSLEVSSDGGENAPERDGSVLDDESSEQVLIGMKTDLSKLVKMDHPVYFGFVAAVEDFGEDLMAFESRTADEGQFFQYGRQPLFLTLGAGTNVWRGVDAGLAAQITLHSDATMRTNATLGGETSREQIEVSAEPVLAPILGVNVALGETFCDTDPCQWGWMDHLDIALVYRGFSKSKTDVDANAVVPGTVPEPGLPLAIRTIDTFEPEIISLSGDYHWGDWRFGAGLEYQIWSRLEDELGRDDVKEPASELEFKDTLVPRLGVEYAFRDDITLRSGIAWQPTPLNPDEDIVRDGDGNATADSRSTNEQINYLDSDRFVLGLGATMDIADPPIIAHPIRLDFGYQYHYLRDTDYLLTGVNENGDRYAEEVTAGGDAHTVTGSISLKF